MTETTLPRNPPPSYYLDGMDLGKGVDAITGEVTQSAFEPGFKAVDVQFGGSADTLFFRRMSDMTELESSTALGFSGSVTFPADGANVSAGRSFDFTHTTKSSTSVLLIIFDWERRGQAKRVDDDATLNAAAKAALASNRTTFREKYGDYFVFQLSHMVKFTAIWKCTAETTSTMKSFEQEITGSLSAGEAEASGSLTSKLRSAAEKHHVTLEVQYSVVGDAGNTQYDQEDVMKTFRSFRDAAKPVPYQVLLHHYNTVDHSVPLSIKMDPDVFDRVTKVFTLARFVLFLTGVTPGTPSVRMQRREQTTRLFSEIYAKRTQYEHNPDALKLCLEELKELHRTLWLRLQRQDLVMEVHSTTYEDLKRKFLIYSEDEHGAWVESSQNVGTYDIGRTGFNDVELARYAIQKKQVAEVNVDSQFLTRLEGVLEFPGGSGINGYVVGLTIEDVWNDGTNGWWRLGKELSLGTKQAKVEVNSAKSRGMHWRLHAYYIPSSEYDE